MHRYCVYDLTFGVATGHQENEFHRNHLDLISFPGNRCMVCGVALVVLCINGHTPAVAAQQSLCGTMSDVAESSDNGPARPHPLALSLVNCSHGQNLRSQ